MHPAKQSALTAIAITFMHVFLVFIPHFNVIASTDIFSYSFSRQGHSFACGRKHMNSIWTFIPTIRLILIRNGATCNQAPKWRIVAWRLELKHFGNEKYGD